MNALLNITIRVDAAAARAQVNQLRSTINSVGSASGVAASGGINQLNKAFNIDSLQKFGRNLQWTGRQLEYNFTLPILLAGGAATKFALANETAFTTVRKVYQAFNGDVAQTNVELNALATTFQLLSTRFGVNQAQVIQIAADWAQAGAAGVGLAKATRLTLETMVLGQEDAKSATEALLTIQSAYRLNTDQLKQSLVTLNAVQVSTSIEFSGLVDAVSRAGGAAASAGIDIRHLAAMAAALVPATGSASAAGNALKTIISRLMAPTQQAADELKMMGINVNATSWQAKNGVQRFEELATSFNNLSTAQRVQAASVIGSRWQINRLDILMKDIGSSTGTYAKALETSSSAQRANAVYAQQLATVLGSQPQGFKILVAEIENALSKAILPLLPALAALVGKFAELLNGFNHLAPATQATIIAFLIFLAAVGPITKYVGALIQLFVILTEVTGTLVGVVTGAGSALMWFGAQIITILAMPWNALVFIFEAIWAGWTLGVQGAWAATSGFFARIFAIPFAAISELFQLIWIGFGAGVEFAIGALGALVTYLYVTVLPLIGAGLSAIPGLFSAAFGAVVPVVAGVLGVMFNLIVGSFAAFQAIVGAGWGAFITAFGLLSLGLTKTWLAVTEGMQVAWLALTETIEIAWMQFGILFREASAAIQAGWIFLTEAIQTAWIALTFVLEEAWAAFQAFLAGFPSFWAAVWAAIVAITSTAATGISGILEGLAFVIGTIPDLIVAAFSSPWVLIVAAVAAFALIFRDKIGAVINWVVQAFNKLPQAIQSVFLNLIHTVQKVAEWIKDALSHINPFARHSPSLVDQVQKGVPLIASEYGKLHTVAPMLNEAAAAHQNFNQQTLTGQQTLQGAKFAQQKADILTVSPNAGEAVDRMVASIIKLQTNLVKVNDELTKQQKLVDDMQRQIDQDMKPYNDAISANELAQKKLRLEILKMKQAGQSIDDIKAKMAALAGDIEMLSGKRSDLRSLGAGSDVLHAYDQQIDALQKQHDAFQRMVDPIQALQDKLQALQDQGDRLQLEKDIKFDPQLQALQDQKDKLQEIQGVYNDINSAVSDLTGALSDMTSLIASNKDSLNSQEFNAGAGQNFPIPGGNTIPGLGKEGGLPEIQAFNADLQTELDKALANMGHFDMFKPIKDMWNKGWKWVKDNVGPYVSPIVDTISNWFDGIGVHVSWKGISDAFSGLGDRIRASGLGAVLDNFKSAFDTLGEMVIKVWNNIKPVFETIAGLFEWLGKKVGDELAKWQPMFDKVGEALTHVYNVISWFVKIVIDIMKPFFAVLIALWKLMWPILREIVIPVFKTIGTIIVDALTVIRGIINFILDLINGDWGKAWNDILTVVKAVWDMIYTVIKLPLQLIWGFIKGTLEGIVSLFTWLKDITEPIWNALWTGVKWVWENILKPVFDALGATISFIWNSIITPIFNLFTSTWKDLADGAAIIWHNVLEPVVHALGDVFVWIWKNIISPVFDAMTTAFGAVGDALAWVADHVIKPAWDGIGDVIGGAWDFILRIAQDGVNILIDIFNFIARAINDVAGFLHLGFHIDEKAHASFADKPKAPGAGHTYGGNARLMAAGGVMDGGFQTNTPVAIVGEGSRRYSEFVIPTDPVHRASALKLYAQLGTQLLAGGGSIGGGTGDNNDAGPAAHFLTGALNVVKGFWHTISNVTKSIRKITSSVVGSAATWIKDHVIDWAIDKFKSIPGAGFLFNFADGALLSPGYALYKAAKSAIPGAMFGATVPARPGGTLIRAGEGMYSERITPIIPGQSGSGDITNIFNGDLIFPNVTNGDDAEAFINNLERLSA